MVLRPRVKRGDAIVAALTRGELSEAGRHMFEVARREGATDDDIRAWWNLSDKEHQLTAKALTLVRTATYVGRKEAGDSEEQTTDFAVRHVPFYGPPDTDPELTGEDRPLPWEVEPRVSRWLTHRGFSRGGREALRNLGGHTSANAMVRAAMARGEL